MSNKDVYDLRKTVEKYATLDKLQKPEETILKQIRNKLRTAKMLDIGVGGGRTTIHFSNLVREYLAIDYSKSMIEVCKKRFPDKKEQFEVGDVRALKKFKNNSFDFILFSFNGIDYVNHKQRMHAFREIKRILKNNGIFVFSSHNLNSAHKIYKIDFSPNPIKLMWRTYRCFLLLLLNKLQKNEKKETYKIIHDGAHGFCLKTYYVLPSIQVKQLKKIGFKKIKLYLLSSGHEISILEAEKSEDSWIYYNCKK